MTDIDQSRFALMAALSEAQKVRPDDYPDPATLVAMSDEGLRAYAVGLLLLLESGAGRDKIETELQKELKLILEDAP